MHIANTAFRTARGRDWTPERLERLDNAELLQLRDNAEKLGATEVVALCDAALEARPKAVSRRADAPAIARKARNLISRRAAFQARGVFVAEADTGWSGIRKSDGMVVMTLWAAAIRVIEGRCCQLLWAPNIDGARPWSETAAGKERLKHCELALERGGAEGLLVYGEQFDGEAAEHNARSVYGVDPERVVRFTVEKHGAEYWAVWGAKVEARPL
jgi:hypothetical protein